MSNYYSTFSCFSVIFHKNIKIEQFNRQTCRCRLMFAASQTSSVFTLLMLILKHFHAEKADFSIIFRKNIKQSRSSAD